MKKVLFVNGFVIGEKSGTGNTFKNLFSNYPKENLLQFCVEEKNELNATTSVNTIYCEKKFYPINYYVRKHIPRKSTDVNSFPSFYDDFKVTLKFALKEFVRGILDMSIISFPTVLINRVDAFAPDVIYTSGPTIRILKIANYFAKRYNINIIIHLMDDWPEMMYTTSALSRFAHYTILRQLKLANDSSVQNLAISPFLAEKYSKIYNKTYIDLMNPATEIVEKPLERNSQIIRFTYAGSLELNRWKSLLEIAEVLKQFKNEGLNNEFHIYIPPNLNTSENKKLFKEKEALLFDYLPSKDVGQVYGNSDILVITESFEERLSKYMTYSLSTKLPEYMGAGKPILCHIPKELLSGKYILENGVGLVSNDKKQLKENLKILITDPNVRYKLACNGIKCAKRFHSTESNDIKLNEAISKATASKSDINYELGIPKRRYIII